MNKSDKHHIEFLKARENAPKAFEAAKPAFDFITVSILFLGVDEIALGRHYRHKTQFKRQLTIGCRGSAVWSVERSWQWAEY
jgi:hypothetical protein